MNLSALSFIVTGLFVFRREDIINLGSVIGPF